MPSISKETAAQVESMEGFEGRYEDISGYTVGFESYSAEADLAPLFRGLPDDRCQCPHWGYVLKGKLTYHYADGEDVITAGQAYYIPPGHTPHLSPGTEVVEFSPTDLLAKSMEVVMRNLAQAG
jgi:hypothetical protein